MVSRRFVQAKGGEFAKARTLVVDRTALLFSPY